MDHPKLSGLQVQLETSAAASASRSGLGSLERDDLAGVVPFLGAEPVRSVHLRAGPLEIWLHDDSAGFGLESHTWFGEVLDYESESEFAAAFNRDLEAAILAWRHGAA